MKKIFKADIDIIGMNTASMVVMYEHQVVFMSRKVFNKLMHPGYIEGTVIERINRCPRSKDAFPTTKWIAVLSAF